MKNITICRFLLFMGMTIITFNTNAQTTTKTTTVYHYRIPEFYYDNEEVKKSVAEIAKLIADNGAVLSRMQSDDVLHTWGSEKNIRVLEDRIEFTKRNETFTFDFKHIINTSFTYDNYGKISIWPIGDFQFTIKGKDAGQKFKTEFEILKEKNKNLYYENRKAQFRLFENKAADYRALKMKPPVSEEQRKFIVQANAFNEKKMYDEAIRLYEQAIEVDQTAYPTAYSNLALLSAQVKRYDDAIYHMKKYLLLVPDASDARGAQDKIYEWEAMIVK